MRKRILASLFAVFIFSFVPLDQAVAQTGHEGHGGAPPAAPQKPADDPWAEFETKTIEVPIDRQQLIGVKTATAEIRPLSRQIRTIGRIEYDERKLTTVNTKIEGWIEKLYINATGDLVKRGEPVAEIYSPELYATQQEFLNVLNWTQKTGDTASRRPNYYGGSAGISEMLSRDAETMLDATRQRLRLWDISEAQIDRIAKTGKPIRTLTIASPVNGYVLNKAALQGMRVMPGEKLLDVIDLSTVWVVADIYEYDLPFVKIGQKATISLSYFAGQQFESAIDFLYPTLAGETRTAKARFTIPNPGGLLKPQMYSDVEIFVDLGAKLAIPEAAVINTGAKRLVYVAQEGAFEPREVTTGMQADGFIEVTEGLAEGDQVAAEANFLLDSEARLKGVVQ